MTEPAEQRRLPAAAIPLAAAVVAAVAVLFVSGTKPGLDPASLASVALLVLAVVTPLIVSDRRGVLVGLAATALAVGYGLAVGDSGGAGSLMIALVAWLPAACVTLAVLDHDRHNTVPLFG